MLLRLLLFARWSCSSVGLGDIDELSCAGESPSFLHVRIAPLPGLFSGPWLWFWLEFSFVGIALSASPWYDTRGCGDMLVGAVVSSAGSESGTVAVPERFGLEPSAPSYVTLAVLL